MKSMNRAGPSKQLSCEEAIFKRIEAYSQPHLFSILKLGPSVLKFCYSSESLFQKMTRALITSSSKLPPDFTITLIEGALSLSTSEWQRINQRGMTGHQNGNLFFHYFDAFHTLSVVDIQSRKAFFIVKSLEALPWFMEASPLQTILHLIYLQKNIQLTHCACVGLNGKAILLTGKGGSGKSTTALFALQSGWDFYAEDYALVQRSPPTVFSLYQSAKLEAASYLSFLGTAENQPRVDEKALFYYGKLFGKQIKKEAALQAIVSLKIGSQALLAPISKVEGLRCLMLSTLFQLPFSHLKTAPLLKELIHLLPNYRLTLGPNWQENIQLLRGLLN